MIGVVAFFDFVGMPGAIHHIQCERIGPRGTPLLRLIFQKGLYPFCASLLAQ
jgi:hypothetical protein